MDRDKSRLRFALGGLMVLAILVADCRVEAQTQNSRKPTLRQRLVSGLQVRLPNEFAFIDAVVATVERGDLPERLVDRFFFWARSRPQRRSASRRPIIYFQPALTIQARKLGLTITTSGS